MYLHINILVPYQISSRGMLALEVWTTGDMPILGILCTVFRRVFHRKAASMSPCCLTLRATALNTSVTCGTGKKIRQQLAGCSTAVQRRKQYTCSCQDPKSNVDRLKEGLLRTA